MIGQNYISHTYCPCHSKLWGELQWENIEQVQYTMQQCEVVCMRKYTKLKMLWLYTWFTGFLKLACIWMAILMHSLDAQLAPKKHAAGASCSPKHLTALTESLVNESLRCFVSNFKTIHFLTSATQRSGFVTLFAICQRAWMTQ